MVERTELIMEVLASLIMTVETIKDTIFKGITSIISSISILKVSVVVFFFMRRPRGFLSSLYNISLENQ